MPAVNNSRSVSISKAIRCQFKRFCREEAGVMTIFACFLILMMLMICGIAVDLMSNEMMRTRVQNTLDRAILAASDLDQPRPADEVVKDYFLKAGMADYLNEEALMITPGADVPSSSYRIVRAEARAQTASPYMALTGVYELPVYSAGVAEEVIENTEISLVIDISGSMRNDGKIGNLRTAAKEFIAAVLEGSASDTTSLNIVPYAGQVNPGSVVFEAAGGNRFSSFYTDENDDQQPYGELWRDLDGNVLTDGDGRALFTPYNQMAHCLDLQPSDFDDMDLPSGGYDQTAYFMNWRIDAPTMDWGWCPADQSSIRYAQNNILTLQTFIDNIRLHDGTGTHYGMKYGVALLNPSSNDEFIALNEASSDLVPDVFANRPAPFEDTDTRKVIVLMTDGQITDQYRPYDTVDIENASVELNARREDKQRTTTRGTNLSGFYAMCDDAKDNGILVYTIAFEAPSNAVTEMRNCATKTAYFYDVDGVEISEAFKSIARHINQLRLTQ